MCKIKLEISNKVEIEIESPTEDILREYNKKFYEYPEHEYEIKNSVEKSDNSLREELLESVFKGSNNDDIYEIIKKVTLLNSFYHTRIRDINIVPIARHIKKLNKELDIDKKLEECDPTLVNDLAYKQNEFKTKTFSTDKSDLQVKVNNIYSFASKYCSWHNHEYPIADSYSKGMLYYINKAEHYYTDVNKVYMNDMNDYEVFYKMYNAFKEKYFGEIKNLSNKVVDTYLWTYAQNKISVLEKKGLTSNVSDQKEGEKLSDFIKIDTTVPAKLREMYKIL